MIPISSFVPLSLQDYTPSQREILNSGFLFTQNGNPFSIERFNLQYQGMDYPICPLPWQNKISEGFLRCYTDKSRGDHKLFYLDSNSRIVLPSSKNLLGLMTNLFLSLFISDKPKLI